MSTQGTTIVFEKAVRAAVAYALANDYLDVEVGCHVTDGEEFVSGFSDLGYVVVRGEKDDGYGVQVVSSAAPQKVIYQSDGLHTCDTFGEMLREVVKDYARAVQRLEHLIKACTGGAEE